MRQRPVSILCLLALFCLLAACSPNQDKKQEFMDHWKQLSQDSQGYSPAPSDLRPEPRVIMRHTEKQEQAASRPLDLSENHDRQRALDVVRASSSLPFVSKIVEVDGIPMLLTLLCAMQPM